MKRTNIAELKPDAVYDLYRAIGIRLCGLKRSGVAQQRMRDHLLRRGAGGGEQSIIIGEARACELSLELYIDERNYQTL